MSKLLVSAAEMGELVSLSSDTIEKLAKEGKIPRVKIGRKLLRFDPEKVKAAMEALSEPVVE